VISPVRSSGELAFLADTWISRGHEVIQASDTLAGAVNTLCVSLGEAGACWGKDDIGEQFLNGDGSKPGFGKSRDDVLTALAEMVNLLRYAGAAMIGTGRLFKATEQANTIGAPPPARPSLPAISKYKLPSVASHLVQSDPPPGEFVQILDLLEKLVAGCEWPDGSMSGLSSMRTALLTAAKAVTAVTSDVEKHCRAVDAESAGEAATQFASFAAKLCGNDGGLAFLATACKGLAGSVQILIEQKNAARMQFSLSLAFLLVSFVAAQALAVVTFGGSEAAFAVEAEAEGFALRALLQAVARAVAEGVWYAGGMDLIAQYSQMENGLQKSLNWDEFGKSVAEGAVSGVVMGGLIYGIGLAAASSSVLRNVFELAGSNAATDFASKVLINGATGTVGNIVAQAAFDDGHVNFTQAAQFGVGMAIIGAGLDRTKVDPAAAVLPGESPAIMPDDMSGMPDGPLDLATDPADGPKLPGVAGPQDLAGGPQPTLTGPEGGGPGVAGDHLASAGGQPALPGGHDLPAAGSGHIATSTTALLDPAGVHGDLSGVVGDPGGLAGVHSDLVGSVGDPVALAGNGPSGVPGVMDPGLHDPVVPRPRPAEPGSAPSGPRDLTGAPPGSADLAATQPRSADLASPGQIQADPYLGRHTAEPSGTQTGAPGSSRSVAPEGTGSDGSADNGSGQYQPGRIDKLLNHGRPTSDAARPDEPPSARTPSHDALHGETTPREAQLPGTRRVEGRVPDDDPIRIKLRDAGITGVEPEPKVPDHLLDGLRDASPSADPGPGSATDATRVAADLRDILGTSSPDGPDGARLLARLHEAARDPVAARRIESAYQDLTGRDLSADIRAARLPFDPEPHLKSLLPEERSAPVGPVSPDIRSDEFASALHEAIDSHDAAATGRLLDAAARNLHEIWGMDDRYQAAYGHSVTQHIETAFGDTPEREYLDYVHGRSPRLEVQAVSVSEATGLFGRLARLTFRTADGTEAQIPFGFPEDGCYDRAHRMAMSLREWGVKSEKLFVSRTYDDPLRVQSENALGASGGEPREVKYQYHVASVIDVEGEDGSTLRAVIDPAMSDRPLSIDEWMRMMGVPRDKYLQVDMSHLDGQAAKLLLKNIVEPMSDRGYKGSDTALVYTTNRTQYWPARSSNDLQAADKQSMDVLGRVEDYAAKSQARVLRKSILSDLGSGRDPDGNAVRRLSGDPAFGVLREKLLTWNVLPDKSRAKLWQNLIEPVPAADPYLNQRLLGIVSQALERILQNGPS
jgi:hypothetical protein